LSLNCILQFKELSYEHIYEAFTNMQTVPY